ncbi:hypothetical protein HU200_039331 [Digitaria exilis]|uniref:Uncharacterized protein n=1 Tax=Digitaria exilis TaxID=1010633 RepID=A0A835EFN0_9POAL|nr:hypothetical protein HU200_039331 [Digitaria exilis]
MEPHGWPAEGGYPAYKASKALANAGAMILALVPKGGMTGAVSLEVCVALGMVVAGSSSILWGPPTRGGRPYLCHHRQQARCQSMALRSSLPRLPRPRAQTRAQLWLRRFHGPLGGSAAADDNNEGVFGAPWLVYEAQLCPGRSTWVVSRSAARLRHRRIPLKLSITVAGSPNPTLEPSNPQIVTMRLQQWVTAGGSNGRSSSGSAMAGGSGNVSGDWALSGSRRRQLEDTQACEASGCTSYHASLPAAWKDSWDPSGPD